METLLAYMQLSKKSYFDIKSCRALHDVIWTDEQKFGTLRLLQRDEALDTIVDSETGHEMKIRKN